MRTLAYYVEHADEVMQKVINAWGENALAGNARSFTPEFKELFEQAFRYRDAKHTADNYRNVMAIVRKDIKDTTAVDKMLQEAVAREDEARITFARAYEHFSEMQETAPAGK
jgi:predicted lipid-binding transport protein (Tim44 family)